MQFGRKHVERCLVASQLGEKLHNTDNIRRINDHLLFDARQFQIAPDDIHHCVQNGNEMIEKGTNGKACETQQ